MPTQHPVTAPSPENFAAGPLSPPLHLRRPPARDHFRFPSNSSEATLFGLKMRWLRQWRLSLPRAARAALSPGSADGSVTPHRRSCCDEDAARRNLGCLFLPPTPYMWRTGAGFSTGGPLGPCRWFGQSARRGEPLSREWLAQLWVEDKRGRTGLHGKRKKRVAVHVGEGEAEEASGWRSWASPLRRSLLSGAAPVRHVEKEVAYGQPRPPPAGQHGGGALLPRTPEELKLAPLLAKANLVITRDIEWANVMFAFEQESRYVIMDASDPRSPVGFVREQSNVIYRQILRSRRPFTAYITDAWGNEIFRVRRPFWWINSTIYAEVDGKEIGVVHRRWHLWRRIYDLYLGNKQFAVVENPGFWNWTFTLKNDNDNVLAEITRDWRGIGLELFTDAGQYVIRFGHTDSHTKLGAYTNIEELDISRPLTLSERAVTVALAVSLDCDYFSRSGGWGLPLVVAGE